MKYNRRQCLIFGSALFLNGLLPKVSANRGQDNDGSRNTAACHATLSLSGQSYWDYARRDLQHYEHTPYFGRIH